jgi:hypothetical protein
VLGSEGDTGKTISAAPTCTSSAFCFKTSPFWIEVNEYYYENKARLPVVAQGKTSPRTKAGGCAMRA